MPKIGWQSDLHGKMNLNIPVIPSWFYSSTTQLALYNASVEGPHFGLWSACGPFLLNGPHYVCIEEERPHWPAESLPEGLLHI